METTVFCNPSNDMNTLQIFLMVLALWSSTRQLQSWVLSLEPTRNDWSTLQTILWSQEMEEESILAKM